MQRNTAASRRALEADLTEERSAEEFVSTVQRTAASEVREVTAFLGLADDLAQLMPGKMLRTRLAARLVACGAAPTDRATLTRLCTAVEIVHTASLLHDDVIDNGFFRRASPSLWTLTSPSASILVGDLLLCKAMDLLAGTRGGRYVAAFVWKVREVCRAEVEQEISLRGKLVDRDTCLRLARGKTGALFAFVGLVCGGDDADLSAAVEEAGYRIGTAYQIFDDLVDVIGDERGAKKTLGTDVARSKFTIPQSPDGGEQDALDCVESLCRSAIECVSGRPRARAGIETYIDRDLRPILDSYLGRPGVNIKLVV